MYVTTIKSSATFDNAEVSDIGRRCFVNIYKILSKYNYELLLTKVRSVLRRLLFTFFTSFLLYFGELKKFEFILNPKSARCICRLVRMCLAQPGYGSGLLPQVYYIQINVLLNYISVVLAWVHFFNIYFFQFFYVYLSKNWGVTFYVYL